MVNEVVAIQFAFVATAMVFAYIAINLMNSEHSLLFPFFLFGSIIMLVIMMAMSYKVIALDTSLNPLTNGVDNGYRFLLILVTIIGFYMLVFIIYRIFQAFIKKKGNQKFE